MADRPTRSIIALLAVALTAFGTQSRPAQAAATYPEDAVKAVFLYRFAGYVTWPPSTANSSQFTIAILGADNVAEQLKALLPEHPIQGRPGRVEAIQGLGQLGDAQMLYIGPGATGKLSVFIEALKDRPVLLVTDQPGALEEGSTVNFVIEQQHVRFEISTAAAKRSGLQIGSGLLAVAERVKTGDLRRRSNCRTYSDNNQPCPLQLATRINRLWIVKGGS